VASAQPRELQFSRDNAYLALLTGQRLVLLEVATGNIVANLDLGELHTSIAFVADDRLLIGTERGTLRQLNRNRVGLWSLQDIHAGMRPIRSIAVTEQGSNLVVVDADNRAHLMQLNQGLVAPLVLQLPSTVRDLRVTPGDTRVLFRTPGWIHRGSISPGGLLALDTLRVPNPAARSELVIDRLKVNGAGEVLLDPQGGRLLLLIPNDAFVEVEELSFAMDRGPLLFGTREELLAEWQERTGTLAPAAEASSATAP